MRNGKGRPATGRPSENAAARKLLAVEDTDAAAPVVPLTLPWAKALIDQADGPVPEYGSPEWQALPDHSRAKVAACVLAAEAWRTYWSPEEHERRLRAELEAGWDDDEDAHWTPEVVSTVHRQANRPRYSQVCDERGEPEKAARARHAERRLGLVPVG